MDTPTKLFLLRHAEVEPRYHRVFGGRIDMELSPFGHEQAKALAQYLKRFPFHAIYASPMRRSQQTLAQILERQNVQPTYCDELREVDFGSWTGLSWDQINAQFNISAFEWLRQLELGQITGAESISYFRKRVDTVMRRITAESPGKSVAVVCHGGVIRMILSILLELALPRTAAFDIEYASVTVVHYQPQKVEVQLLNFTPWRDQGG